jgi:hypothetical protein
MNLVASVLMSNYSNSFTKESAYVTVDADLHHEEGQI